MRGVLFICPHKSETQTGVVFTTSLGKQESDKRFDLEFRVRSMRTKDSGKDIFLNSSMEHFLNSLTIMIEQSLTS